MRRRFIQHSIFAPYCAIRVFAGCVRTFVGLKTDGDARVLDSADRSIEGLYAVGNDMASVTGGDDISGGYTLGPGMTCGHLAARHAMGIGIDETAEAKASAA